MALLTIAATFGVFGSAMAQGQGDSGIPHSIGNRANGFSYQPTPGEVVSKEKAAGLRPSDSSQQATDKDLDKIDRDLLKDEGMSTSSVPKLAPR
jgi:hypothetical protein